MVRLWVLILMTESQEPLSNLQKGWVVSHLIVFWGSPLICAILCESYDLRFYFVDTSWVHVCKCICYMNDWGWTYSCCLVKVQKCDLTRLGPLMPFHWCVFHLCCGGQVIRDLPWSEQMHFQEENWDFTIRFLKRTEGGEDSEPCKMYHSITVQPSSWRFRTV